MNCEKHPKQKIITIHYPGSHKQYCPACEAEKKRVKK